MTPPDSVTLTLAQTTATLLPPEGGVITDLTVAGQSILARTPWADSVHHSGTTPDDEAAWVQQWRGGWQACLPTAGVPQPDAQPPQAFHGVASQAPWQLTSLEEASATVTWSDDHGLAATRRWALTPQGIRVETQVLNTGSPRQLVVAEHLILGQDFLAPLRQGATFRIEAAGDIVELDYSGLPTGNCAPWPAEQWDQVSATTPGRVCALRNPRRAIRVFGPEHYAQIEWDGLEHALIWEEICATPESPWDGEVLALGIEPTSSPHGGGTTLDGGIVLDTHATLSWSASLTIHSRGSTKES